MRTLIEMQLYPTAYEVVFTVDGKTTRLGFSERRTRSALLSFAQDNSETILPALGNWDGDALYSSTIGWTFGPVRIHFSGVTERQCASELEMAKEQIARQALRLSHPTTGMNRRLNK
jgi:hypothetical protein